MIILLIFVIIIAIAIIIFMAKNISEKENALKELESKEKELNYKLSNINEFKRKVEQNLQKKIQHADNQIKLEQEKIQKAKKEVDEYAERAGENVAAQMKQAERNIAAKMERANAYYNRQVDAAKQFQTRTHQELKTVQEAKTAIERQIQGYGEQYIIPHIQLIDQFAEHYSITHAGEKLKEFRYKMRQMIKENTACVGDNTTQCKMLLDFFTEKTESLIGKVKHENYGKLKQEMSDIYALTVYYAQQSNMLAKITKAFYENRQEELKWASIVHTMRMTEREEQRELREQMREEERARKEYERAIKESAKEEAILQKAMEKVKAAYDSANAEQKEKYEKQLNDLEIRLKEAEAKNQRALSMAQQTKAGNVYIISNIGSFGDDMFKIGMTRRLDPMDRVNELGDASVPFRFDVHAIIYSDNAPQLEKELHRVFNRFRVNKVNYRKEFFKVSIQQIRAELDRLSIKTTFTIAAEAAEYRETQRIEAMGGTERDKLLEKLLEHEQ